MVVKCGISTDRITHFALIKNLILFAVNATSFATLDSLATLWRRRGEREMVGIEASSEVTSDLISLKN